MPDMVKHKSGAILFYLTEEEKKVEATIEANEKLEKENKAMKERLEALEAAVNKLVPTEEKEAENEAEAVEEVKPKRTRRKKTEE